MPLPCVRSKMNFPQKPGRMWNIENGRDDTCGQKLLCTILVVLCHKNDITDPSAENSLFRIRGLAFVLRDQRKERTS